MFKRKYGPHYFGLWRSLWAEFACWAFGHKPETPKGPTSCKRCRYGISPR